MFAPYLEEIRGCLMRGIPFHDMAAFLNLPQKTINLTIINGLSKGWWKLEYIPLTRSQTDEVVETG